MLALLEAYIRLLPKKRGYRMVWSATAEEEVSGSGGLELILPELGDIALAVVGEPTGMRMAVAEKGLMVLDCTAYGRSGHAARDEGENALYKALPDIEWFRNHRFERVSDYLGEVKMSVTMISCGTQHNVVPDKCSFVVDLRPNGLYTNSELLELIRSEVSCELKPRSLRHNSSHISPDHPVVQRARELGLELFGSPTTSNQTLLSCPSVKIGPGDSARSHCSDEYICIDEISQAVDIGLRHRNALLYAHHLDLAACCVTLDMGDVVYVHHKCPVAMHEITVLRQTLLHRLQSAAHTLLPKLPVLEVPDFHIVGN